MSCKFFKGFASLAKLYSVSDSISKLDFALMTHIKLMISIATALRANSVINIWHVWYHLKPFLGSSIIRYIFLDGINTSLPDSIIISLEHILFSAEYVSKSETLIMSSSLLWTLQDFSHCLKTVVLKLWSVRSLEIYEINCKVKTMFIILRFFCNFNFHSFITVQ